MLGKHNRKKNNLGQIAVWADAQILFRYVRFNRFIRQGRLIIRTQGCFAELEFTGLESDWFYRPHGPNI